ncbi:hypothetical protein SODALDRAFT_212790 [Sodiomyces alkalinus F11]|uniref:Uncharacterized protein n=1 Tax=Sodiomyces alkalinus (strain CBS 110278 / VKM F-3762 / F11) TaxID=1314773 RepID=A0A3N2PR68_SODAK|nr:hypothetical protein SODALDRAFT_212790 [Sodiomyces alkalinus F11]ROT37009.1 hypothetical protein SODALDRAFT_212790 [Sodiomyces alkalinus F11]
MITLYQFWSHYLVEHFEWGMFEEFRQQALSDLAREPLCALGLKHLVAFYESVLAKKARYHWMLQLRRIVHEAAVLAGCQLEEVHSSRGRLHNVQ